MTPIRLGAVEYLNARPLVYGLERERAFEIRYDLPSRCAALLHEHAIDIGLIPSIEYARGPRPYGIVAGPAIASDGPVASVAIYTRREPRDIRTIAMDTSSRTSVALATILMRREFGISPESVAMAPDLETMLAGADAALIIGDSALFLDERAAGVHKIDLGELWSSSTGLPFVYAFWAGWPEALTTEALALLREARDAGVARTDQIADLLYTDTARRAVARRYLRENIRYVLGAAEEDGLKTFYRYAAEINLIPVQGDLRFHAADAERAR